MLSLEERRVKWGGLLADQRESGRTVTGWCRERGIEKNTFYGWRKRLSVELIDTDPTSVSPQFVSVALAAETMSAGLTLKIGHVSVEINSGFDRDLLADVLTVLEARSASAPSPC